MRRLLTGSAAICRKNTPPGIVRPGPLVPTCGRPGQRAFAAADLGARRPRHLAGRADRRQREPAQRLKLGEKAGRAIIDVPGRSGAAEVALLAYRDGGLAAQPRMIWRAASPPWPSASSLRPAGLRRTPATPTTRPRPPLRCGRPPRSSCPAPPTAARPGTGQSLIVSHCGSKDLVGCHLAGQATRQRLGAAFTALIEPVAGCPARWLPGPRAAPRLLE